jgi:DNA polymerase-3 subunit delta
MRLRFKELEAHLERGLAATYVIAGEEPLQAMLAADAVRAAARRRGYDERLVLDATSDFDWAELRTATENLSLFAQRRLLDLRMSGAKPGLAGGKALTEYASQAPLDTMLLMQCGKLDKDASASAWLKALDRVGVVVQVWPLNGRETADWIAERLLARGVRLDSEAASLLAERAQGNLLAAEQEIEKLCLFYGGEAARQVPVGTARMLADIADSARYTVFDLADAVLAGNREKAVKILHRLAAEDVKPPLVLWCLAEQARALVAMSYPRDRGAFIRSLKGANKKRAPLLKRALPRQSPAGWEALLRRCAQVDRIIKGQESGSPWDELLNLSLGLCGRPLFATEERIQ